MSALARLAGTLALTLACAGCAGDASDSEETSPPAECPEVVNVAECPELAPANLEGRCAQLLPASVPMLYRPGAIPAGCEYPPWPALHLGPQPCAGELVSFWCEQ